MIDYQRTIDNIRSIVGSVGVTLPEAMAAAAAEYAQACEATNERLRKCGQLLNDGLRSEAIQQCEAEPNLLSLVATLDFPELPEWQVLLQSNGLDQPEPLLLDVAGDLNEAYAQEQPLAALLRRHRLLALSHSPLRARVAVLRELAGLDGNNHVWHEDLRDFERARHQEIRSVADEACRKGNVAAVEELVEDLQSEDWLEPPPAQLVEKVSQSHSKLVQARARAELEQLEPQLNDAFSQFDVGRGRALRERWNVCAMMSGLNEDDPLYDRALPTLEWLDEEDNKAADEAGYETAVATLERALDDETGLAELERLAHAALRYERSIPPVLEQRLRTRLAALNLSRSRRIRLIVGAASAALVLAVLGVGYGIVRNRHAQQIASHANTIETLMEKRLFDEAQEHLDQIGDSAPDVAGDARIQALGVTLASAVREEEKRQARFAVLISTAEKAGAEQPDRSALEEANKLAMLDAEKARVVRIESAVKEADRRKQGERNDRFAQRLKELNDRMDALDRTKPDNNMLVAIRQDLVALITKSTGISPAIFAQGDVARARIKSFYESMGHREKVGTALTTIANTVGDFDKFKQALVAFVAEFPESAQAIDFKRVAGELEIWKEIEIWKEFLKTLNERPATTLDSAAARERLAACNEILSNHAGYPVVEELRSRMPHLEAIARRTDEGGTKLYAELNELFTDPLIAGLWMVEVASENQPISRYYLVKAPPALKGKQSSVTIKYIDDYSRETRGSRTVREKEITYRDRSPQSIVAKDALDELANLKDESWEPVFFRIISMIQSNERLDSILKTILLQKVLEVACQGSESLKASFSRFQETLTSVAIDPAVPWMDPRSEDARRVRELADGLLNRLPSLRDIGQSAAASRRRFNQPVGDVHDWVGWLVRDEQGKWQCLFRTQPDHDGRLFVAQPLPAENALIWSEVGQIESGVPELNRFSTTGMVQGRPIFFVSSSKDANRNGVGASQ